MPIQLVQGAEQGKAIFLCQAGQEREDLSAQFWIERSHRFVRQQDHWILDQGASNGHTLMLAARKIGGPGVEFLRNAHACESMLRLSQFFREREQ